MKNITQILILFLFAALFSACSDGPADPEDFNPQLIVDGYLIAGQPLDSLILRTTQPINDPLNLNEGMSNASVRITTENTTLQLQEKTNKPGHYYISDSGFKAKPLQTYFLEIDAGDFQARAYTTVPGPFTITSISADTIKYAQIPLNIRWTASEKAFGYVLRITSLDSNATKIERRFSNNEEDELPDKTGFGVIDENFSDLPWFGFNYYGRHEVAVFAADKNFYEFAKTARQNQATLEEPQYFLEGAIGIFGSAQVQYLQVYVIP